MFVDFEGTVSYAKVFEQNRDMGTNLPEGSDARNKIEAEQGHYVANVFITKETKKAMIAAGVPNKGMVGQLFKEDDDGNLFYKCKRPHFNPRLKVAEGGMVMGAPKVVYTNDEGENAVWDFETDGFIGNESLVKVRLDVWEGKIVTLHAIKVLELVEFEGSEGGSDGLAGF